MDKEFKEIVSKIYNVDERCVKIFRTKRMNIGDIIRGIMFVKSIGSDTIIYNTIIPLKDKISEEHEIKIIDGNDLMIECIKNKDLMNYSGLIDYKNY